MKWSEVRTFGGNLKLQETLKGENAGGMATVATLGAAGNTNSNKKDSHKKKKRTSNKLMPNILSYGNNNTLLKSVVVTLTTPIATTTITVNNVNLNNNNIGHLAKQVGKHNLLVKSFVSSWGELPTNKKLSTILIGRFNIWWVSLSVKFVNLPDLGQQLSWLLLFFKAL